MVAIAATWCANMPAGDIVKASEDPIGPICMVVRHNVSIDKYHVHSHVNIVSGGVTIYFNQEAKNIMMEQCFVMLYECYVVWILNIVVHYNG